MSAHLNITTTVATEYGITLVAGCEAEDAQKTQSVELSEVPDSATGEIVLVNTTHHLKIETQITGDGPRVLTLTAGVVADPSTLTVIENEVTEAPNNRCGFTVRATGHDSFTDPAATADTVGAEPTIADLEITSVGYAIAESVRRSASLLDMVLVGSDGTPAHRATVQLRYPFSIAGRGDLPAGVALGKGGASFVAAITGKTMVRSLMTGEKRADWNRWSVEGTRYASAA